MPEPVVGSTADGAIGGTGAADRTTQGTGGGAPAGGPRLDQVRRLVTEVPGPRSRALLARQRDAVPAGLGSVLPVYVTAAGGGVVVDADGNSVIDFASGIAVTGAGNSAERVVERASAQLARFTHTCFLVNPYESYVAVCEALNRLTPGDHAKRTVLVNTGAEAVENAVKIARSATGRPGVLVFDHAYHGRTLLTMAMTAKNVPYKQGFGPFAPEVHRAPMAAPFRWPTGADHCADEAFAQFAYQVDQQIGAGNLAAVVVEPIQGEGGFVVPAPGFLERVFAFCRERGIVTVADEVQTGVARTGDMFACEHEGLVPDLITTAKGIAGGLPLGAVTGRAEIMDAVPAGGLGGTFSGNPVACEAALGVLAEIEEGRLVERAGRIGAVMLARLRALAERTEAIGDVRGRGAMIAIELVQGADDPAPAPETARRVLAACHAEGLLVLTAGTHGNVLRFLPPLVIPDHLLDEGLGIIERAFAGL
ncbi:4-aminobutyrate aminotransferase/(S)-3-amino-2-methylpropionate transaminase [Murinocardiopsis flavida]|uniref:(S)-3-amino-2-methylpropionate transaminase n=1 Tax=Murinocardiopsis flavida TaxID=645275 RepID=A0A2P8DKG1_9ACTN|nr:4-aminobutyrate--2-oxoglutarate transaminase [Murinocardiopsis flavida]PSK97703.1 4-aminobutyrate aminotransferase/(S)-3-amino-2-methylpropionate transaminase [Murinocardiopsis flavida]